MESSYFWGPIEGTGTSVEEVNEARALQGGSVNVFCYLGIVERGEHGEVIAVTRQEETKTQIGLRTSDGWTGHQVYDLYERGQVGGTVYVIPVRDGSQKKASWIQYARAPRYKKVAKWTAKQPGRWAGRFQVLGAVVTSASQINNTTVQLNMAAEPLATNGLKKDELKGAVVSYDGVSGKSYEVTGNTTAGLVTVRSGSKMKSDFTASGTVDLGLTIVLKNTSRNVSIVTSDAKDGDSAFFSVSIFEDGTRVRGWDKLSLDPTSEFYFVKVVNGDRGNTWVTVEDLNAPDLVVSDYRPANYFGRLKSISKRSAEVEIFHVEVDAGTSGATPTVTIGTTNEQMTYRDQVTLTPTTAGVQASQTVTVTQAGSAFTAADTDTLTFNGYVIRFINGTDIGSGGNTTIDVTTMTAAQVRDAIVTALNQTAAKAIHLGFAVAGSGAALTLKAKYAGVYANTGYEVEQTGTSFTLGAAALAGGVNAVFSVESAQFGSQGSLTIGTTNPALASVSTAVTCPLLPDFSFDAEMSLLADGESVIVHYTPLPTGALAGSPFMPDADQSALKRFRIDANTIKTLTMLSGNLLEAGKTGTGEVTTSGTALTAPNTDGAFLSEAEAGDFIAIGDFARKVASVTDDDNLVLAAAFPSDVTDESTFQIIKRWMIDAPVALTGGYDGVASVVDADYTALMDPSTTPMLMVRALQPALVKFATPGLNSRATIQSGKTMCFKFNWQFRVEVPNDIETPSQLQAWYAEAGVITDYPVVTTFPSWGYVNDPLVDNQELFQPLTGMIHGAEAAIVGGSPKSGYHMAGAGITVTLPRLLRAPFESQKMLSDELMTRMNTNYIRWFGNTGTLWGNRNLTTNQKWIQKSQREWFSHFENVMLGPGFLILTFALLNASTYSQARGMLKDLFEPEFNKGALVGRTFDDACPIKIDEDNNTPATRAAREAFADIRPNVVDCMERLRIRVTKAGVSDGA
jgi:hypothetical protein